MSDRCTSFDGDLALYALGRLDGTELALVQRHLERCPGCAALADELVEAAAALALLEGERPAPALVPPELADRVLHQLDRHARAARVRVASALAGVAAVVVALLLVAGAFSPAHAPGPTRTLALRGNHVDAVAVLTAETWGTSISLTEHGLAAGTYELSVRGTSGGWWTAGPTWRSRGATGTATMSCPVPMRQVRDLEVRAADGSVVLASGPLGSADW